MTQYKNDANQHCDCYYHQQMRFPNAYNGAVYGSYVDPLPIDYGTPLCDCFNCCCCCCCCCCSSSSSSKSSRVRVAFATLSFFSIVITVLSMAHLHCSAADRSHVVQKQQDLPHQIPLPMLCICTTFKPVDFKLKVYENVLHNWATLGAAAESKIRTVLYVTPATSDDSDEDNDKLSVASLNGKSEKVNQTLVRLARSLGWDVANAPRVGRSGVPYLKEMFADLAERLPNCTFYGYSNGDILFSQSLLRTLDAVVNVLDVLGRTMIIGRRTNVKLSDRSVFKPADVDHLARWEGRLFIANAQDYFLIARYQDFPWHAVPDVVVGRPAYDNFLVATAIQQGVSVIDATASLLAVHQSDRDGNFAGHNNTDRDVNIDVIGRDFSFRRGFTTRSPFVTITTILDDQLPTLAAGIGHPSINSRSKADSYLADRSKSASNVKYVVTVHHRISRRRVYPSFWSQFSWC